MKKKLALVLGIEACVCVVFSILLRNQPGTALIALFSFPFDIMGTWLRGLSLSGGFRNIAAFAAYLLICGSPLIFLCMRVAKGRFGKEDGLLILLSGSLFAVLYMMINPADIMAHFSLPGPELLPTAKALLGSVIYSILVGYVVIRALRSFLGGVPQRILKYLKILLLSVCATLVFALFSAAPIELFAAIDRLAAANTEGGLTLSILFLALQQLVQIFPAIMGLPIAFAWFDLLTALSLDPYGETVASSAESIGRVCRISLCGIMLSQIGLNILQLLLGAMVRDLNFIVNIPLDSVVLVLAAMLFADYFAKARRLKIENDMFV